MTEEIASTIRDKLLEASRLLNESILVVQDGCTEDQFVKFRSAVGNIMGEIYIDILAPLYKEYPSIMPLEMRV